MCILAVEGPGRDLEIIARHFNAGIDEISGWIIMLVPQGRGETVASKHAACHGHHQFPSS
jgi:hypothetical protein